MFFVVWAVSMQLDFGFLNPAVSPQKESALRAYLSADFCAYARLFVCRNLRRRLKEVEQAIWKHLGHSGQSRAVVRFSLTQVGSRRRFIHANQIVGLRWKRHLILLQECLLGVQLGFGVAIEDLLLAYVVQGGVNPRGRSLDGCG